MKRSQVLILAGFTLVVFPLIGILILFFFSDNDFHLMTRSVESVWIQVLIGLVVGAISGYIAWFISESKWVNPRSGKYLNLIGEMNLRHIDIIFVSLCAGIGEELLFRGAIQPFLGIWITAIFFVLIHGYINPNDWRISIYGLSMTVIIAFLGYMCDRVGIWSAAIAHAMIDYVLLRLMVKKWTERKSQLLSFTNHISQEEE